MTRLFAIAIALLPGLAQGGTGPEGRALFHGYTPFAAGRGVVAQRLPTELAACAACHGPLGEGGTEGGVTAPSLRWTALGAPRSGKSAFASAPAVARAITDGIGRDGAVLHPVMPRFRLSAAELDALLDYLHVVGTGADLPQGVGPASIAIGTVLPLSGPAAAVGQSVLAGLRDTIETVNSAGIYGRRVELYVADSAPGGAAAAATTLATRPVYTVVAGLWGAADTAADAALASKRIPHVASLVVRREPADAGDWSADLLPSLAEQERALASALADCEPGSERIAVRFPGRGGVEGLGITWVSAISDVHPSSPRGCLGVGLSAMTPALAMAPPGWHLDVALPIPAALAQGGDPWRELGRAAGRILLELLARSGAVLHERSLLVELPRLTGFEPLPGLPVRFSRQRRFAWDAAIATLPGAANTPDRRQ